MARYTIALRGKAASPHAEMKIEEKSVDLHRDENLSELYLLEVNPKGQVRITWPYAPIDSGVHFDGEQILGVRWLVFFQGTYTNISNAIHTAYKHAGDNIPH
jgi:hypothetical protein